MVLEMVMVIDLPPHGRSGGLCTPCSNCRNKFALQMRSCKWFRILHYILATVKLTGFILLCNYILSKKAVHLWMTKHRRTDKSSYRNARTPKLGSDTSILFIRKTRSVQDMKTLQYLKWEAVYKTIVLYGEKNIFEPMRLITKLFHCSWKEVNWIRNDSFRNFVAHNSVSASVPLSFFAGMSSRLFFRRSLSFLLLLLISSRLFRSVSFYPSLFISLSNMHATVATYYFVSQWSDSHSLPSQGSLSGFCIPFSPGMNGSTKDGRRARHSWTHSEQRFRRIMASALLHSSFGSSYWIYHLSRMLLSSIMPT